MTDGIDPTRLRKENDYVHVDPPPVRKAVSQPPSYPPDLVDASFGPLPRIRTDASVARTADHLPNGPVQTGMEAFLARATPSFLVDGKPVQVPIPFRMPVNTEKLEPENRWRQHEEVVKSNEEELQAAAASVGLGDATHLGLLRSGRATPEDVQKVTQALIDRGHLPSASEMPDAASRVQRTMFDHGLGIDCAGFVQRDFLASRGLRRDQTGLKPDISNEDLTHLSAEGFRKVPIDAARPGDILVLDPPPGTGGPGHTLMVYERREATPEEIAKLRSADGFGPGHVTAYVLDSSYGSNCEFDHGGVMRQVWYRNDDQKNWARKDPKDGHVEVWSGVDEHHPDGPPRDQPYSGHSIRGLYRPAGGTP